MTPTRMSTRKSDTYLNPADAFERLQIQMNPFQIVVRTVDENIVSRV